MGCGTVDSCGVVRWRSRIGGCHDGHDGSDDDVTCACDKFAPSPSSPDPDPFLPYMPPALISNPFISEKPLDRGSAWQGKGS